MSRTPNFIIEWNDLSYQIEKLKIIYEPPLGVRIKKDKKIILHPQSGCASNGTLTALMGPSGAGKTTLLNCLAGNNQDWKGSVDLFTNDTQSRDDKIKLNMAFVPQKDYLFDKLTVRETLNFAMKFKRFSSDFIEDDADEVIEKTASDLNLISCLDTKVSKLSGGQMKRLSVAMELISTPDVLILDEPTTGLDSTNALNIVRVIKNIVTRSGNNQVAVICSIHQPSFECLSLFDQIYLLSERGEKILFDSLMSVQNHLMNRGVSVPMHHNPADYLLNMCYQKDADTDSNDNVELKVIDRRPYHSSIRKSMASTESASLTNVNEFDHKISVKDATDNASKRLSAKNLFSYLWLLYQRNYYLTKADPASLLSRLLFCFIGFSNMIVYNHKLGSHDGCWDSILDNDPSNKSVIDLIETFKDKSNPDYIRNMELVYDNITVILMANIIILHFHALITGAIIPIEAKIVQKEIYNNWYTINAYIISRITFFIPLMLIQVILYTLIFFITSYQLIEIERYMIFMISILILAWSAEMIGIAFGALFPGNLVSGAIWTILFTFPIILLGGYFIRTVSANPIIAWLMSASQLRHSFEASIIAIYGLGRCSNTDGAAITIDELMSPKKMMERAILDYDITHTDAKYIAPILGIPDDYCVAEVINGTRDYLGLNYVDDYDDADGSMEDAFNIGDSSSFSYPMSSFKLHDSDLYRCFYSLSIILIGYIVLAFLSTRSLIRR